MFKTPPQPTCLGDIISDGHTVQTQATSDVSFGLTTDGNFVMGVLNPSNVSKYGFDQLLTGFGFLLVHGQVVPPAGGEVAPRTALGVDAKGRLLLFAADGVEKDNPPKGHGWYVGGSSFAMF